MKLTAVFAITSCTFFAAIFGFFYAWSVSTLWGLDTIDPNTAIDAMNAMNISVRNLAFMPSFFGTVPLGLLVAVLLFLTGNRIPSLYFVAASAIFLFGAFFPTTFINVPMNEVLKQVETPLDFESATKVWQTYSADWKFWNATRTYVAGVAFVLSVVGLYRLGSSDQR